MPDILYATVSNSRCACYRVEQGRQQVASGALGCSVKPLVTR